MTYRSLISLLVLAVAGCSAASDVTGTSTPPVTITPPPPGGPTVVKGAFNVRSTVDGGITYPYQVFVPAGYDATKKWPVILFMHGSGEKGSDNQAQIKVGLGPVVQAQAATFPAIVVFPQSPADEAGRVVFVRIATAALDATMTEFNADPARVYLTGLSYGGIHAFEVLYKNPTRFAAFVPISANICAFCIFGSPIPSMSQAAQSVVQKVPTLPVWQFQGSVDPNVPVADARTISTVFKSVDSGYQYTEYAGQGHAIWDQVYATPALFTWLYAQHR